MDKSGAAAIIDYRILRNKHQRGALGQFKDCHTGSCDRSLF